MKIDYGIIQVQNRTDLLRHIASPSTAKGSLRYEASEQQHTAILADQSPTTLLLKGNLHI